MLSVGFDDRAVVIRLRIDTLNGPEDEGPALAHLTCIGGPEEWPDTQIAFRIEREPDARHDRALLARRLGVRGRRPPPLQLPVGHVPRRPAALARVLAGDRPQADRHAARRSPRPPGGGHGG